MITACGEKGNDTDFINKVTGRYLFNSDEVIDVFFEKNKLILHWKDVKINPLKLNDSTFFVKEMNEKIQFLDNPSNGQLFMVLLPKEKNKAIEFHIKKLKTGEKVPNEYLKNNEFDKALASYLLIKENDSLDPAIAEDHLNSNGYRQLRNNNFTYAIDIFKINAALYPYSDNVYDSLGDAYLKSGDTIHAIENYKKSLQIDSSNSRVKRKLKKLEKNSE